MTSVEISASILSLKVALTATALGLPFAIIAAWILSRKKFWGKSLFEVIVMAPMVLPPIVTGFLLLIAFGNNGFIGRFLNNTFGISIPFTWFGAVLASAVVSFPLMVRAVQVSFDSLDRELEGIARTLGARRIDAFFSVVLPLSLPGILTATVLGFARSLGEFGATIILAGNMPGKTQTIPLAIFSAINRPGGEAKAGLLIVFAIALSFASLFALRLLDLRTAKREGTK